MCSWPTKRSASARPPSSESYLKIDRIMSAAEVGDVDAIHPGYGFLAENAHFAEVCESCKIKFIGPTPASAMHAMGDKNSARVGGPQSRGAGHAGQRRDRRDRAGGAEGRAKDRLSRDDQGGRRRRRSRDARGAQRSESRSRVSRARGPEAEKAFGNGDVYIEKLIVNPHHIEFQIVADKHGNTVHLGERDCSIQRRNQKVIEECPSPLITPALRKKMGQAAVKLAQSVGYVNAGTMEFLVDNKGHYYFIEMNTRIQVEHTITEEVYGCDLVKEQIHDRGGRQTLAARRQRRWPASTRSNAGSMPRIRRSNFQPSPGGSISTTRRAAAVCGSIRTLTLATSFRPNYDSMIAKLITVGATRASAIARMRRALDEYLHHRHQDDGSVSQRDHAQRGLSQRQLRHRLRRAVHELGNFELRPSHGRLTD